MKKVHFDVELFSSYVHFEIVKKCLCNFTSSQKLPSDILNSSVDVILDLVEALLALLFCSLVTASFQVVNGPTPVFHTYVKFPYALKLIALIWSLKSYTIYMVQSSPQYLQKEKPQYEIQPTFGYAIPQVCQASVDEDAKQHLQENSC